VSYLVYKVTTSVDKFVKTNLKSKRRKLVSTQNDDKRLEQ